MDWSKFKINKKYIPIIISLKVVKWLIVLLIAWTANSCSISYKLNGASIDYSKTKSLSVVDFTNVADLVYPPLAQTFSEKIRDKYSKQTRLQMMKSGGDMHLEGEITGYEITPMAIGADSYSAETKLTVTVNVRFTNHKNPEDDFEKKYSAYQTFKSNYLLTDVQDELLATIIEDIADNIYNDTVAKW